jgi:D-sedoheptulose 7-phosphate isomerase
VASHIPFKEIRQREDQRDASTNELTMTNGINAFTMSLKNLFHIDLLVERYPALLECRDAVVSAVESIIRSHNRGGKILLCGNGGSAADAEHIVGELAKGFVLPRTMPAQDRHKLVSQSDVIGPHLADHLQQGVRAFALSGSSPLATAIANDGDPNLVFAQMTYAYGQPGDVLIGISTSGNSKNIVSALMVARAFNLETIGLTGAKPATMDSLCDTIIKVPATETFKIQEYHLPIYHAICLTVEAELFG